MFKTGQFGSERVNTATDQNASVFFKVAKAVNFRLGSLHFTYTQPPHPTESREDRALQISRRLRRLCPDCWLISSAATASAEQVEIGAWLE
jgi:hypothetical protein